MAQVIYTIGFTRKNLRTFLELLQKAHVEKLIDIRLNNTSQLAGYAKKEDLEFICELFGIAYEHVAQLAPAKEILNAFKQGKDWTKFESRFLQLLADRDAKHLWESRFSDLAKVCLLCSEHKPEQCHRRLAAEYLAKSLPEITVQHLS